MASYISEEYTEIRRWVSRQVEAGHSWNEIRNLCVAPENAEEQFDYLKDDEAIIPLNMYFEEWEDFIDILENNYIPVSDMYMISDGSGSGKLPVPAEYGSAWSNYKNYLLGKKTGKPRMSETSVQTMENNCYWIMNHLRRATPVNEPRKGLVMGSVQSGKTANMVGLVTMTAQYDWNIFIVLSGSIENLRRQTRDRFSHDLMETGSYTWHVLDYTRDSEIMLDINNRRQYSIDSMQMNIYQEGSPVKGNWMHRYVFVCLKNATRLKNLITWLHSDAGKAARMRILVIDDEADQVFL